MTYRRSRAFPRRNKREIEPQARLGLCNSAGQVVQDGDPCEGATYPCAGCTCKRFDAEQKAERAKQIKPVEVLHGVD